MTAEQTPPAMSIDAALVEKICQLAEQASGAILEVYNSEFTVEEKADSSPLTEADLASHRTIVEGLAELTPDIPILSEESATVPFDERSSWQRYWLVDPLDGTREFVKRNGEFTVNIALIEAGQAILGVVHVPVSGVLYHAARGLGAFRREPGQESAAISVRPRPSDHTVVVGSRSHSNARTAAFMERLGNVRIKAIGSSLKICLVAEGSADIYPRFGLTSEWDTAAAQCLVEEAGGVLVDSGFETLRYNTKDSLLNPEFLVIGDPGQDYARYMDS